MSAAQVDPHDKMRSRDVNRVARGEQAPRPAHEYGSIRSAPPKSTPSTPPPRSYEEEVEEEHNPLPRHCYAGYLQYFRCIKEKGESEPKCERFENNYLRLCPLEWIERCMGCRSKAWNVGDRLKSQRMYV